MCKGKKHIGSATLLDTLAQSGTECRLNSFKGGFDVSSSVSPGTASAGCMNEEEFTLTEATKTSSKHKLHSRAKRKFISRSLSLNMIDYIKTLSGEIPEEKKRIYTKSFWNMFKCVDTLVQIDGKITGRYCRNRMCMVCNSIRQAQNINRYLPVINEWQDMRFVTLTIPNVAKSDLKPALAEMDRIYKAIKDFLNKRHTRGKGKKFVGIKKLECTFSTKFLNYHPHYHFLIKDPETAKLLVSEWIKRTKGIGTNRGGQDIRKGDVNSAKELFKYFTKISTKVRTGKKGGKEKSYIYLDALFVQFDAFRGVRTFSKFGFKLPPNEQLPQAEYELELDDSEGGQVFKDYHIWNKDDWYSVKMGNGLTEHKADRRAKNIVNSIKNTYSVYD
jgi:hypothetical protein